MYEVFRITDAMVRESSFPNFYRASQPFLHGMRVPAFDKLQRTFERDIRWSQQQVEMLGHENKGVQLKLSLAAIRVQSLQEEACHGFGHEQASSLPGDRSYKVSPRRRDGPHRFQKLTSAAKSRVSLAAFTARVNSCPSRSCSCPAPVRGLCPSRWPFYRACL